MCLFFKQYAVICPESLLVECRGHKNVIALYSDKEKEKLET